MESEKGQLEAANFNEQHLTSYPLQLLVLAFGKVYSVLFAVRSTSQQSPACYSALSRFAF